MKPVTRTRWLTYRLSYAVATQPLKYAIVAASAVAMFLVLILAQPVFNAYAGQREQASVKLAGLNLEVESTEIDPSPYVLPEPADTRNQPLSLAYATDQPPVGDPTIFGGDAVLQGTVSESGNVVPNSVVRIERHTTKGTADHLVPVNEQGQWKVEDVLGGRYRIRAWAPNSHTMQQSIVVFVPDDKATSIDLKVTEFERVERLQFWDGGEMYAGLNATLVVGAAERTVNVDGQLIDAGIADRNLELSVSSGVRLLSPSRVTTNQVGHASVAIRCLKPGQHYLAVRSGDELQKRFALPNCASQPTTTSKPPASSTTTSPSTTADVDFADETTTSSKGEDE